MTLGPLKPFKRYGYKITLIQERVILYLRLLQLSENTVSALTKEILNRFLAVLECLKLQVLQLEDETELILVPGSNFQTIEGGIHA